MESLKNIMEWMTSSENTFLHWVFCAAILAVFIVLSRLYKKRSVVVLTKLVKKIKGTYLEDLFSVLSKQISLLILSAGIVIALWNLPLSAAVMSSIRSILKKAVQVLVLLLVGWGCCSAVDTLPVFEFKFLGAAEAVRRLLRKAVKVLVIIFMILAVMEAFGLPVTSLITGLGIGGLVISLAAQDTASNLIAGLVIIIEHPFSIGDWIVTSQAEGVVEDITFRSTKVRTMSNTLAIIPNSLISAEMVTNGSERKKRMAEFTIGVCYDTPREKIEKVSADLRQLLSNDEDVDKESIVVRLSGFSSSSIDILVRYYTKTTEYEPYLKVVERLNLEVITIMQDNEVEFAFPSTTVYFAKGQQRPGE